MWDSQNMVTTELYKMYKNQDSAELFLEPKPNLTETKQQELGFSLSG